MIGRRSRTPTLLVAVATATALATAACGGNSEHADAKSATSTPSSGAVSSAPSPLASTSYDPSKPYLPVPDGVTLTVPSPVTLGTPITAAWQPQADQVGVVRVNVKKVETTTAAAAFGQFQLSSAQRQATPYFVRATVTNLGATNLGGVVLPLYLRTDTGRLVESTGVAQDFAGCPGRILPATFPPGASAGTCLIFLAPRGTYYGQIAFVPPIGVPPLRWYGFTKPVPAHKSSKSTQGSKHGKEGRSGTRIIQGKTGNRDPHVPRPQGQNGAVS